MKFALAVITLLISTCVDGYGPPEDGQPDSIVLDGFMQISDDALIPVGELYPPANASVPAPPEEILLPGPPQNETAETGLRRKRAMGIPIYYQHTRLWPNGVIPYVIEQADFTYSQQMLIRKAMDAWEEKTCVRFTTNINYNSNYVRIGKHQGCWSIIGAAKYTPSGQTLSLGNGCVNMGTLMHEFGHLIGLYHEHQRSDRDPHLKVFEQNARAALRSNFVKEKLPGLAGNAEPYDYDSIMHYSTHSFSHNGLPTMVPTDVSAQRRIGIMSDLSFYDVKTVNRMYQCNRGCNGFCDGIFDGKCNCWCSGRPWTKCSDPIPQTFHGEKPCLDVHSYCVDDSINKCKVIPGWAITHCPVSCDRCSKDQTCQDRYPTCLEDAAKGECTKDPVAMGIACPQACRLCHKGMCKDQRQNCDSMAKAGNCEMYQVYMNNNCPNTCRKRACVDENWKCAYWANKMKQCSANPSWMLIHCRKSCGSCFECQDSPQNASRCPGWAASGECTKNTFWMPRYCQKSCKTCTAPDPCQTVL